MGNKVVKTEQLGPTSQIDTCSSGTIVALPKNPTSDSHAEQEGRWVPSDKSKGWQQLILHSEHEGDARTDVDASKVKNLRWVILDDNLHQPVMIRAHPYPDVLAFKHVCLVRHVQTTGARHEGTAILWLQIPTHPQFNSLRLDHQKTIVVPPTLTRGTKYHTGLVFVLGVQFAGESRQVMEMGLSYQNGLAKLVSNYDENFEYHVGRWHTPKGVLPEDSSMKEHPISAPSTGCGQNGLHFYVDQPSALMHNGKMNAETPVITKVLRKHREGPCLVIASSIAFLQQSFVCKENGDAIYHSSHRVEGSTSDRAERIGVDDAKREFLSQIRRFSVPSQVQGIVSQLEKEIDKHCSLEEDEELIDEEGKEEDKEEGHAENYPLLEFPTSVEYATVIPSIPDPDQKDPFVHLIIPRGAWLHNSQTALQSQSGSIASRFTLQTAELEQDPINDPRRLERTEVREKPSSLPQSNHPDSGEYTEIGSAPRGSDSSNGAVVIDIGREEDSERGSHHPESGERFDNPDHDHSRSKLRQTIATTKPTNIITL
jgi:hypothetical protein